MLNRELGADFDPDAFEHVAVWDAEREWIEMRLRSRRDQTVHDRARWTSTSTSPRRGDAHRDLARSSAREGSSAELAGAGCALTRLVDGPGRRLRALPAPSLA